VIASALATRLEKAATDGGFDLSRGPEGKWLRFGSSHASTDVWVTARGDGRPVVAVSRADVAKGLEGLAEGKAAAAPVGAAGAFTVPDVAAASRILRRAFQLSRSLPTAPLQAFQIATAKLPKSTEAERLVVQRVGQDLFRASLMDYWEGRCAVTGLAVPELLRASHIKPWAACETDAERLDVFNGLLLAPHLDAAFDQGFITVGDDGAVIVSGKLPTEAREVLGLADGLRVEGLAEGHRAYLAWHRAKEFTR
jgi:hypothetical protein